MNRSVVILFLLMLCSARGALGQIAYPDFSSGAGLVLVGDAALVPGALRLAPADRVKAGAAWFATRQLVRDGFVASFRFRLGNSGGNSDGHSGGGDGFAFVLQSERDSALGTFGGSLGYDGIQRSLAVEFDTWNDGFLLNGDPNGNHISIHTRGVLPNSSDHAYAIAATTAIPTLEDGAIHRAVIQYHGGRLSIYLDNCTRPVLETLINLDSTLGLDGEGAWMGFTAATASAWADHDILDWSTASIGLLQGDSISFCQGDSVTLTVPTLTGSVQWAGGETTPSITIGASGIYSATVTETLGCRPITYTVAIDARAVSMPPPVIIAGGATQLCQGDSVLLDAGPGYDRYLWSNGATTRTIAASTSGRYYVQASIGGCSKRSDPVDVTVLPRPAPVITPRGSTVLCQGDSVTLDAGFGHTSYLWSTGDTTRNIRVGAAGSYEVRATGANGCVGISPAVEIIVKRRPRPVISPAGPIILCAGDSITLEASSDGDIAWYRWSTQTFGSTLTVKEPGDYFVTVSDTNLCWDRSAIVRVEVRTLPVVRITAEGPTAICPGGSVRLRAPAGYRSYLWSNGETTEDILVSAIGSYDVTVTDDAGCRGRSNSIDVRAGLSLYPPVTVLGSARLCEGDSVTLEAPGGYVAYLWSTGETSQSIRVGRAGRYDVRVSNSAGCSGTSDPVDITVLPRPAIPVITESGGELRTGPAAGYQWSLNNAPIAGATGSTHIARGDGEYTVTISDADGCTATSMPFRPTGFSSVSLPALEAAPGERVTLPLLLDSSRGLDAQGLHAYRATIRFDARLLFPVDDTPPGVIQGEERVITIEGRRPAGVRQGPLMELAFRAALADTTGTPLHLESFQWMEGSGLPAISDGRFTLRDLCETEGTRLVDLTGVAALKIPQPNPGAGVVRFQYELAEAGHTELLLFDALGRQVAIISDGEMAPGAHTTSFDVGTLPEGLYFCMLRTPSAQLSRVLHVVR